MDVLQKLVSVYGFIFLSAVLPSLFMIILNKSNQSNLIGGFTLFIATSLLVSQIIEYNQSFYATRLGITLNKEKLRCLAEKVISSRFINIFILTTFSVTIYCVAHGLFSNSLAFGILNGMILGVYQFWYFQLKNQIPLFYVLDGIPKIITYGILFLNAEIISELSIFVALIISSLISCSMMLLHLKKQFEGELNLNFRGGASILLDGRVLFYQKILSIMSTSVNSVAIGAFFGVSQMTNFAPAERIGKIVPLILQPINQIYFPKFLRELEQDRRKATELAVKMILAYLIFFSLLSICVIVFRSNISNIFIGYSNQTSQLLILITAISFPLSAINSIMGMRWLVAIGEDAKVNIGIFFGALCNILFIFIGISNESMSIILAGSIFSELVIAIFFTLTLWKLERGGYE